MNDENRPRIVMAEEWHARSVAARMREADRREVWARWRHDPARAALASFQSSAACWTVLVRGRPAALFGVAELGPGVGSPGLLGTDALAEIPLTFARQSRIYVSRMLDLYPLLLNEVHANNTLSQKWLTWLGFKIIREPRSYNDEIFYLFSKERTCVNR